MLLPVSPHSISLLSRLPRGISVSFSSMLRVSLLSPLSTTSTAPQQHPHRLGVRTTQEYELILLVTIAIWRFTLYWTLILIGGIFLLCSLLASLSLLLSQTIYDHPSSTSSTTSTPKHQAPFHPPISSSTQHLKPPRKKPPLWPIFLLPIVVGLVASFIALLSGTVVGFTLATIYAAGGFSMST
jgi:hypothetical protein